MKKGMIALALVTIIGFGFATVNAFAWNCGGPGSGYGARGWNGNYLTNVNSEDFKKFLDETAQIRKSIAIDRAELNALMAGQNPDPEKVRELTARLIDNEEALNELARSANVNGSFGRGFGMYGNCGGPGSGGVGGYGNCGGPAGKGYGRY